MKRGTRVRLLSDGGYIWDVDDACTSYTDVYGIIRDETPHGADLALYNRSDDSPFFLTHSGVAWFFSNAFVEEQV